MSEEIRTLSEVEVGRNMVCIFGPPDSGKSTLAKWLFQRDDFRSHLVFDPLYGWDSERYNLIRPPEGARYRRYEHGNEELNAAVDRFVLDQPPRQRPAYLVIDEAGRLLPSQQPPGESMSDLLHFNAHLNVGVFYISQRPAELNTDAESKSLYYFILGYSGRTDRRALRDLHGDAPDLLDHAKDSYGEYAGVVIGPNRRIAAFPPVPDASTAPKQL